MQFLGKARIKARIKGSLLQFTPVCKGETICLLKVKRKTAFPLIKLVKEKLLNTEYIHSYNSSYFDTNTNIHQVQ